MAMLGDSVVFAGLVRRPQPDLFVFLFDENAVSKIVFLSFDSIRRSARSSILAFAQGEISWAQGMGDWEWAQPQS